MEVDKQRIESPSNACKDQQQPYQSQASLPIFDNVNVIAEVDSRRSDFSSSHVSKRNTASESFYLQDSYFGIQGSRHSRSHWPSEELSEWRNLVELNDSKTEFDNCVALDTPSHIDNDNIYMQYLLNSQQISRENFDIHAVLSNKNELRGSKRMALLKWCCDRTSGYENVNIRNFSSSWKDGNALIALIHSFVPDQINYYELVKSNDVEIKFRTAFSIAEHQGIKSTLKLNDILNQRLPSWDLVMDYITEVYNRFGYHNRTPPASTPFTLKHVSLLENVVATKQSICLE
ncbi:hypothetical protein GJ496_007244, partial [Pomphorhynchus laevis]